MALELIQSEVMRSTAPPAIIVQCLWELDSVRCYSSTIVPPEALSVSEFWDDLQSQVRRWFTARKRQPGEIYNVYRCVY